MAQLKSRKCPSRFLKVKEWLVLSRCGDRILPYRSVIPQARRLRLFLEFGILNGTQSMLIAGFHVYGVSYLTTSLSVSSGDWVPPGKAQSLAGRGGIRSLHKWIDRMPWLKPAKMHPGVSVSTSSPLQAAKIPSLEVCRCFMSGSDK